MTLANRITIFRFLIIPFFVMMVIYYGKSVTAGEEDIRFRIAALALYALAALSDAVDGWIARRFNQQTPLGEFLDPLADKLLLLAGVVSLSITNWETSLPVWFGVLVVSRDVVITFGWVIIKNLVGHVEMNPLWTSKFCTVFQLSSVCWVLLDFWSESPPIGLKIIVYIAAVLTVISFIQYFREGVRQLRAGGAVDQESDGK